MNPLLLLAMTATICSAAEGLVVEQDMASGGSTRRVTIRVRGHHVRLDYGNGSSAIIDTDTKQVVTLYHHDAFAIIDRGDDALREAVQLVHTNYAPPRQAPVMSSEKFGGYECRISDWQWNHRRNAIWFAPTYPHAAQFAPFAEVLRSFHCSCLPALGTDGLALKTITGDVDTPLTVTLVSAKIQTIPDEIFEIPPNAKPRQ